MVPVVLLLGVLIALFLLLKKFGIINRLFYKVTKNFLFCFFIILETINWQMYLRLRLFYTKCFNFNNKFQIISKNISLFSRKKVCFIEFYSTINLILSIHRVLSIFNRVFDFKVDINSTQHGGELVAETLKVFFWLLLIVWTTFFII